MNVITIMAMLSNELSLTMVEVYSRMIMYFGAEILTIVLVWIERK